MKTNTTLLRDTLLFPDQILKVKLKDEFVTAIPYKKLEVFRDKVKNSMFISEDRRDLGNNVGFIKRDIHSTLVSIQTLLWDIGVVDSRYRLNQSAGYSKFVVCMCLKAKKRKSFIFFHRGDKDILSETLALGPMKSIRAENLVIPFKSSYPYRDGDIHNKRKVFLDKINLSGENGIFKSLPEFSIKDMIKGGLVGGGKDFGLVLVIEYSMPVLEKIACELGGLVLDIEKYNYSDIRDFYGLGIDGWTDAILKYFNY